MRLDFDAATQQKYHTLRILPPQKDNGCKVLALALDVAVTTRCLDSILVGCRGKDVLHAVTFTEHQPSSDVVGTVCPYCDVRAV